MLARAQEIENLERQMRAQAILLDEAKSRLVRAEAAYTDAAERLAGQPQGKRGGADGGAPAAGGAAAPDAAGRAASQRREQLSGELADIDAAIGELNERRAAGESRFEELDASSATPRSAMPSSTRPRSPPSGPLAEAREQIRALERQAQEAQFEPRSLAARRAELQRAIETAAQQVEANRAATPQLAAELERLDRRRGRRPGCRRRWR